jgi:hypothetical protein
MTTNVNVSEFQKIIFANNINENHIANSPDNIKQLSSEYPFVVFFTDYQNTRVTNENENIIIRNIWSNGTRLTRFVGVDPDHNNINIEGHSFKLYFDYESGLLGIYEENQLNAIELVSISYIDLNNTVQEITTFYDNANQPIKTAINAIDNKFTLKYKYTGHTNININNDISSINKELNFTPSIYFSNISQGETTNDNNILYVDHNFKINYDTQLKDWQNEASCIKEFNVKSNYNPLLEIAPLYIDFRLNPVKYFTYCKFNESTNVIVKYDDRNENIINFVRESDSLIMNANNIYDFYIELPNINDSLSEYSYPRSDIKGDNTDEERKIIRLNVDVVNSESSSANNVQVSNNINGSYGSSTTCEIGSTSNKIHFYVKTPNIANDSLTSSIELSLSFKNAGEEEYHKYKNAPDLDIILNHTFKFNIYSITNSYIYYYGFSNPAENNVEFKSFENNHENGAIIYDPNTENIGAEIIQDTSKDFYIALPENTNAKICLDVYHTVNNINFYEPLEDNVRFTKIGIIRKYNTDLNVYRSNSDYKGKFYGKIQIQN